MRLIDADILPRHGNRGGLVYWKDIETAPTIEAEPVKRGRCLSKKARYFYCSECGYGVQDVYEGSYNHDERVNLFENGKEWNYCPNCGSKMDENLPCSKSVCGRTDSRMAVQGNTIMGARMDEVEE